MQRQLSEAVDANVEQAEKMIRLEIMHEKYMQSRDKLKEVGWVYYDGWCMQAFKAIMVTIF